MASSGKKKTTMAKINRENAVRERRLRKEARKAARKLAAAGEASESEPLATGAASSRPQPAGESGT
jgi:hypothetical protein